MNKLLTFQSNKDNPNFFYVCSVWLEDKKKFEKVYCEYLTKGPEIAYKIDQLFDYFNLERNWDLRLLNEEGWILDPSEYREVAKKFIHLVYREDASDEIEEALENMDEALQKNSFPIIKNTVRKTLEIQKGLMINEINATLTYIGVCINAVRKDVQAVRNDLVSLTKFCIQEQNTRKKRREEVDAKFNQLYEEINSLRKINTQLKQEIQKSHT